MGSPGTEVTDSSECCKSHPDPQRGEPMLLSVAPFLSLSPGESPRAHTKCCGTVKLNMYCSVQAPRKMNKEAQDICLVCPPPRPPFISQITQGLGRGRKYQPRGLCPVEGRIRVGGWWSLSQTATKLSADTLCAQLLGCCSAAEPTQV